MSQGHEEPDLAKTCGGLVATIVVFVVGYFVVAIIRVGRPASFLCLSALLLSGLFHVIAAAMTPDAAAEEKVLHKLSRELVAQTSKAALWTSVGLALIWLFQLLLNWFPGIIGTRQALELELRAYDAGHALKSQVTPLRYLIVILAMIGLSSVLGAVWPINLTGIAKKWIAIAAAILVAFSTMTFVSVRTNAHAFEMSAAEIRATIAGDVERLKQARQEQVALQWIAASVQETRKSEPDAKAWRSYLEGSAIVCEIAQSEFERGYQAQRPTWYRPPYCRKADYLAEITLPLLRQPPEDSHSEPAPGAWVPEQRAIDQAATSAVGLARLSALAGRVKKAADDEEAARNRVDVTVSAALGAMIGETAQGAAGQIVDKVKDAVLLTLVRENREKVAMWLSIRNAPVPRALKSILGIEPGLHLLSPRTEMDRAGGRQKFVMQTWHKRHGSLNGLEKAGRDQAMADEQAAKADREQRARERANAEEWRRRAEVERPRIR